jgi:DNA-binding response OmpR family regulator
MAIDLYPINILLINDNADDVEKIKLNLEIKMRVPWVFSQCENLAEAASQVNKADVIILNLQLITELSNPKHIFEEIEGISYEVPIIVLTDKGEEEHNLATYVMEKGAADAIVRGRFNELVDAIEFSLIRQKITTANRKTSDQVLQDNKDAGDAKDKESQNTLSMFMGDYSGHDPKNNEKI